MKGEFDVFTAGCFTFLLSLATKFMDTSPVKYAGFRNAGSLKLEIMCMAPENGTKITRV